MCVRASTCCSFFWVFLVIPFHPTNDGGCHQQWHGHKAIFIFPIYQTHAVWQGTRPPIPRARSFVPRWWDLLGETDDRPENKANPRSVSSNFKNRGRLTYILQTCGPAPPPSWRTPQSPPMNTHQTATLQPMDWLTGWEYIVVTRIIMIMGTN